MIETSGAVPAAVPTSRFPDAYAQLSEVLLALPAESLQPININIPHAVTTMLGAMPEIMALRSRLERLPEFSIERIDQLEPSTLAMSYADTVFAMSTRKPEPLPELVERGSRWCGILRSDAQALAQRGLMDGAPLEQLRGGNSHINIALDLFALAYLLRSHWPAIHSKTALTLAELVEAEQLADQLTTTLGLRQQAPSPDAPSADMRLRAFNLFWRNYREAARGVRFLVPEGFDEIIPPVHITRGPAKKRAEEEPASPASTGVHPAVQTGADTRIPDNAAADDVDVGLPGASPYLKANG